MSKKTQSISMQGEIATPKLIARGVEPDKLRGAVSRQDLNKRPTAVPISRRSLRRR